MMINCLNSNWRKKIQDFIDFSFPLMPHVEWDSIFDHLFGKLKAKIYPMAFIHPNSYQKLIIVAFMETDVFQN
jgi:hypothetical protein